MSNIICNVITTGYPSEELTIYAANHRSLMDLPAINDVINDENFGMVVSSSLAWKPDSDRLSFFNNAKLKMLPLEVRFKPLSAFCLDQISTTVQNGHSIAIFPEGAYAREDTVHAAYTGIIRILFDCCNHGIFPKLVPISLEYKQPDSLDYYGTEFQEPMKMRILPEISYMPFYEKYKAIQNRQDLTREDKQACSKLVMSELARYLMESIANSTNYTYVDSRYLLVPKNSIYSPTGEIIAMPDAYSSIDTLKDGTADYYNGIFKK